MSLEKRNLSIWEAPLPIRKTEFEPLPHSHWDLTERLAPVSVLGNGGADHTRALLPVSLLTKGKKP